MGHLLVLMHALIGTLKAIMANLEEEYAALPVEDVGRTYLIRFMATLDLTIEELEDQSLGKPRVVKGSSALEILRQHLAQPKE